MAERRTFPRRIFFRIALSQSILVALSLVAAGFVARALHHSEVSDRFHEQLLGRLAAWKAASPKPGTECSVLSQSTSGDVSNVAGVSVAFYSLGGQRVCTSPGWNSTVDARFPINWETLNAFPGVPSITILKSFGVLDVKLEVMQGYLRIVLNQGEWYGIQRYFDSSLLIGFSIILVLATLISLRLSRQWVFPLGRLLFKTKDLAHPEVVSEEDLSVDSYGEWIDLESNIDDIRKDLLAKARHLIREKFEVDTIMAAITDAVLAADVNGVPLFFNSRFEVLFGQQGQELEKLKLWGIFREPVILKAFQTALKEGRVDAAQAFPFVQRAGSRRYLTLSVAPLRRQDGEIYGAVGIFHDVTELKAAEQMRIDFVANVSHELRTPLTVIKGYADTLIQDNSGNPALLEYLNVIARSSERLTNLMNDLLDLSSIESASIIQMENLSTEDVTSRMFRQLSSTFDAKRQVVSAEYNAKSVFADPQRIEQVLVNLLANANKYTPEGGRITVRWSREQNSTVLEVADSGPGIPAEHHARLFERFYRVDKSRSRDQGGTGLGLAIVKHIMQRHEGSVRVESQSGKGSQFFCRFPDSPPSSAGGNIQG